MFAAVSNGFCQSGGEGAVLVNRIQHAGGPVSRPGDGHQFAEDSGGMHRDPNIGNNRTERSMKEDDLSSSQNATKCGGVRNNRSPCH
jgi:hypothetical protein